MVRADINALRPLSVLLIEDNASDAYLVQAALDGVCPGEFGVVHSNCLEEALPCVTLQQFDVALLDLSLPGISELEALKSIRHAAPALPVVILTGFDDEALALSSLQHGAQDYLVKERSDGHLIKRAIRYAIERKHFEDNITLLANYDGLTGLPNRSLFESRLDMALARARRSGDRIGVLFIDLNDFKLVNDQWGHEAGDALLQAVGMRLSQVMRECDTVARFGGDEFAALMEGSASPRDCAIVAQKMLDALSPPVRINGQEIIPGASIGIAIGRGDMLAESLLHHADVAMYRAKQDGQSRYQFYTSGMHRDTTQRLQMEQELENAVRHRTGLCLYYQPKLDMASGMLAGAEALIRWEHPERGMLAPGEFLPLLQNGMASELDHWVLSTICRDIQCWQAAGLKPVQVAMHLSNRKWESHGVMDGLMRVLEESGLHASHLALEMEESAILHHGGEGFDVLSRVRDTGIEIHLDNFGADVSSLKLLTRCPLDAIKIDRRLTGSLEDNDSHKTLVQALIGLGHKLGMRLVAEGVETPGQQQTLAAMACDQAQGVVISKPLPAQEFFEWMGRQVKVINTSVG